VNSKKTYQLADKSFSRKEDVRQHFSGILNDALGRELTEAEFHQVLALFRWHPDFQQKTAGKQVVRMWVTNTPRKHVDGYSSVKVFKFRTASGLEDDFSMTKCINELWASAKLVQAV
jgi:hypothetical protein